MVDFKNDAPGMMEDGTIATFSDDETAFYVGSLHDKAMATNKLEDWQAWREALARYRDPPPKPREAR